MRLTSNLQRITKIKKKTEALFFRQFEIGDTFTVSTEMKNPGRGRERYAVSVEVHNITQDLHHGSSMSIIANRFRNFEYEPVCYW